MRQPTRQVLLEAEAASCRFPAKAVSGGFPVFECYRVFFICVDGSLPPRLAEWSDSAVLNNKEGVKYPIITLVLQKVI